MKTIHILLLKNTPFSRCRFVCAEGVGVFVNLYLQRGKGCFILLNHIYFKCIYLNIFWTVLKDCFINMGVHPLCYSFKFGGGGGVQLTSTCERLREHYALYIYNKHRIGDWERRSVKLRCNGLLIHYRPRKFLYSWLFIGPISKLHLSLIIKMLCSVHRDYSKTYVV